MLKPAILYKEALPSCLAQASMYESNRFYAENYWDFDGGIKSDNWERHQFVSLDKSDNVVGLFSITVNRPCHFVHALGVIRFDKEKRYDFLFAKDFKAFFDLMFSYYKYIKMNFSVCIGSPHEAMYDRFVERYGGRIVGIKNKDWRLQDGTICDQKLYELEREPFLQALKEKSK